MQTWIALLRGINVGGKNILPMAKLIQILESLDCTEIRTYIQSGNVVFRSKHSKATVLAKKIEAAIKAQQGFECSVLLLTDAELRLAIESNPFADATSEPQTLHFFFLEQACPSLNVQALDSVQSPTEKYHLTARVLYLHAPDGVGRSKLAAKAEKILGVVTTARNFRTVQKLQSMLASDDWE
jgi:uncharacterized protein (DUF1697 family)